MKRTSKNRAILPRWVELAVSLIDTWLYRVRGTGLSHLPEVGPVILLANHLSTVDPILLRRASPRPIRFITIELDWPARVLASLAQREVVCLFPEIEPSAVGQLARLHPQLLELAVRIAREQKVPIIPVAIDGIWGSVFSYSWRQYIWKKPIWRRLAIAVHFGAPLALTNTDFPSVLARQALLDLIAAAFAERPLLRGHLGREVVKSLAGLPARVAVIDRTADRRPLSAGRVFAAAAALSKWLRENCPARRVGIVLPPGAGALMANVAVVWAGKIPVNLNFTAGTTAVRASLELGEVDTVITAKAMQDKLPDFPWPAHVIDLRKTIAALGKVKPLLWLLGAWILPSGALCRLLRLPRQGDREEAALLFTSGSAGAPKGVVLSHRNLLTNCEQLTSTNVLPKEVTLLGCLPIFHSFGFTITIWYALIRRMRLVTIPSPLETKRMVDAIRDEKITCVVGAPTFLRPLLKKAQAADLRTLELLVSGAEKMPLELHAAFWETLQVELMQGYGLTETTPVTNMNIPDLTFGGRRPPVAAENSCSPGDSADHKNSRLPASESEAQIQIGKRLGSIGRMLPGLTARIVDPDTFETLPLTRTGMLLFRGENVFRGYLRDLEKTKVALRDGWFVTGDLARFDEDGFLFIEGRLSRFSKIGGEMVPHGTVEQKILAAFGWEQRESVVVVVVGVPDTSKGEALVLLTTEPIAVEDLREKLSDAGLANLWIPRVIRCVEAIPLLGTGKVDLQGCKRLVFAQE